MAPLLTAGSFSLSGRWKKNFLRWKQDEDLNHCLYSRQGAACKLRKSSFPRFFILLHCDDGLLWKCCVLRRGEMPQFLPAAPATERGGGGGGHRAVPPAPSDVCWGCLAPLLLSRCCCCRLQGYLEAYKRSDQPVCAQGARCGG